MITPFPSSSHAERAVRVLHSGLAALDESKGPHQEVECGEFVGYASLG